MKRRKFAKELRVKSTDTERILWYYLRAKRLTGLKFKRQQPIGNYIVDFVCFDKRVIIELDGSQHLENEVYDKNRDQWLKNKGYLVLRFNNIEFLENKIVILERIVESCLRPTPLPGPLPQGERGLETKC